MNSFTELAAWRSARDFRISVTMIAKQFPSNEKFRLTDQIIRSSRSVTANIAEGFGRYNYQDNIRFCRFSRGSLYETLDHLNCAFDEKYLSQSDFNKLKLKFEQVLKTLNGYIAYLKRTTELKRY